MAERNAAPKLALPLVVGGFLMIALCLLVRALPAPQGGYEDVDQTLRGALIAACVPLSVLIGRAYFQDRRRNGAPYAVRWGVGTGLIAFLTLGQIAVYGAAAMS